MPEEIESGFRRSEQFGPNDASLLPGLIQILKHSSSAASSTPRSRINLFLNPIRSDGFLT